MKPRLLDLFSGRWGWSRAFAARGWQCVGIDLTEPPEIPPGCEFRQLDVLTLDAEFVRQFDFVCASSPCEEFSVHGMKHFHPNPKYPDMGVRLFNHTGAICEEAGVPYVMENVRPAQKFVGTARAHCGPFYLWGSAVPPLLPQGIRKGIDMGSSAVTKGMSRTEITVYRRQFAMMWSSSKSKARQEATARAATIPAMLANAVVDYAEFIGRQAMLQLEVYGD